MTLKNYEEHFENQILGLLKLTQKMKHAWYVQGHELHLDDIFLKLIEYKDHNTFKLFEYCFGPQSSLFQSFTPEQQNQIQIFCADETVPGSFMNLEHSRLLEIVMPYESQLQAASMMKPGRWHQAMQDYDNYLRHLMSQLPLLEVYLVDALDLISQSDREVVESFKNDIQHAYDNFLNGRDFTSVEYILSDIQHRWMHTIGDVLKKYKTKNTKKTLYDDISDAIGLVENVPFENLNFPSIFDDIKENHQYLDGMLYVRELCENVDNKQDVIENLLLKLDYDVGEDLPKSYVAGCIEECLVQMDASTFQRQPDGRILIQGHDKKEILAALGLVNGHIDIDKLSPSHLDKLPNHVFKILALISKDKLEKKLARYLDMMNTPQIKPLKENKRLPPSMQSNKKVRDNLMRLIMKHPTLYNAMTKQFIMQMLKFDKALMRKFLDALTPPSLKKEQWCRPDMKKVNKAFIEKVQSNVQIMNRYKTNQSMHDLIEKNVKRFLKQSGINLSHPQYEAVKLKLTKVFDNASKEIHKPVKPGIALSSMSLMSTMNAQLKQLTKYSPKSNQSIAHLVNVVKVHVVMKGKNLSFKPSNSLKNEFETPKTLHYSKKNSLFKSEKKQENNNDFAEELPHKYTSRLIKK